MKHESLGQTGRYWVGQDKQGRYMWKRAGKRFSLIRGRDHDRHFCEVLQESSRSTMYKVYNNVIMLKEKKKLTRCESPAFCLLILDYVVVDHLLIALPYFLLLIVYF